MKGVGGTRTRIRILPARTCARIAPVEGFVSGLDSDPRGFLASQRRRALPEGRCGADLSREPAFSGTQRWPSSSETASFERACAIEQEGHPVIDRQQPEDQPAATTENLSRQQDQLVEEATELHSQDRPRAKLAG